MDFSYKKVGNKSIALTSYTGNSSKILIPEAINSMKVSRIDAMCFFDKQEIEEIIFPDNVTINPNAIVNCDNLKRVILGTKDIIKGDFVVDCGPVFVKADTLTEFNKLSKLYKDSEIIINFDYRFEVKEINSDSVEIVNFIESKSNQNVVIPDEINGKKVVQISPLCFLYKKYVKSITFNKYITELPYGLAKGCRNLEKIQNLQHLEKIGEAAFFYCVKLDFNSMELDSLKHIDNHAFCFCGIKAFEALNPDLILDDCFSRSKLEYINLSKLNCEKILRGLFKNCEQLRHVKLSKSMTTIGMSAFENCKKLEKIEGWENISKVEYEAFSNCKKLSFETFNFQNLRNIGEKAFNSVYLPAEICLEKVSLSINAFAFTKGVKKVVMNNRLRKVPEGCFNSSSIEEIILPNSVSVLSDTCFKWSNLKKINSENLKILGEFAFCGTKLKDVDLSSIEIIDNNAFYSCANLRKLDMTKSNITRLYDCYNGCSYNLQFILPDTVEFIDEKLTSKYPKLEAYIDKKSES